MADGVYGVMLCGDPFKGKKTLHYPIPLWFPHWEKLDNLEWNNQKHFKFSRKFVRVHVGSHCLLCRAVRKCIHSGVALKGFLGFKDLFISFWFLFSASTLMKTSSGGATVLFLLLAHLVYPPSILPCLSQSCYLLIFKWTLAITVWRHYIPSCVCARLVCLHFLSRQRILHADHHHVFWSSGQNLL